MARPPASDYKFRGTPPTVDEDTIETHIKQVDRWEVRMYHGKMPTSMLASGDPLCLTWVDVFDWGHPSIQRLPNGVQYAEWQHRFAYVIDQDFDKLEEAQEFYNNIEKHIFAALVNTE